MNIEKETSFEKQGKFSTPGSRLRAIRSFCTHSRHHFCEQTGISESTLKAWENNISRLTEKGASLLVKIFRRNGIFCTEQWLLKGEEPSPLRQAFSDSSQNYLEEDIILQEIEMLKFCYQHIKYPLVWFSISSDEMVPFYQKGDFIAGIQIHTEKLQTFLGEPLILETLQGVFLIRKFMGGTSIEAILTQAISEEKVHYKQEQMKAHSVYQILWHRRRLRR